MVSLAAVISHRHLATAALALGWAAFLGPAAFSDGVPYHRDVLELLLPLRAFVREELLAGRLPHWYPYEALGAPFFGQIVTGFWHPATWLLLPFDPVASIKAQTFLAYGFALAGAYRACRRLRASRTGSVAGAFAFGFGGYALAMSNNTTYLTAFATLPWVLDASLRLARTAALRHAGTLALVTALVFLAGDAQSFALCPLLFLAAIVIEGVHAPALPLFLAAGLGSLLLVSIELLPALAIGAESVRMGPRAPEQWALAPIRLLELVHPDFIPPREARRLGVELLRDAPYVWATTLFAGSTVVALALLSLRRADRRHVLLGLIGLIAILLALGRHAGVLAIAERMVPALATFRFPEKYAAFAWLALAPLAALGVDVATDRVGRAWVVPGALSLLLAAVAAALHFRGGPWATWSGGFAQSALFLALATLVVSQAARIPIAALAIPLLVLVELRVATLPHLRLVPRKVLEEPVAFAAPVLAAAPQNGPPPRVFHTQRSEFLHLLDDRSAFVRAQRKVLQADAAGLLHVPAFGTRLPALSLRTRMLLGPGVEPSPPLAAFLNGCFEIADAREAPPEHTIQVERGEGLALVQRPCRPRAFLAGARTATDPESALAMLAEGLPSEAVVWEHGPAIEAGLGEAAWIAWKPGVFELAVDAPERSALVVSEQFARGWRAEVDGASTPIHPTTLVTLGIEVPAGRHRVRFRYETPRLAGGAALSALGALLAALALASRPRRDPFRLR